jgi:NTE family protein
LLAFAVVSPSFGQAQPDTVGTRPRIGLVLSGGGARGGAEIGVIRALEELRVPVDVIAGTSIGAAIGGLYASGMSAAELEAFVRGIDWEAAFLNSTPRRLRSFRRKRDDDLFLVSQRPGLNDGEFELPTGVVQGQVIDTIMSRVTLPVAGIHDFDELMIPFRAVAGDIVTGEAVILGEGELSTAIRASMSVPAAFAPIEIDDRLLVDGGIVMNLPIEVAQSMGADRIIAVDVTSEMYGREQLNSVVDVTAQLSNILTRNGVAAQKELLTDEDIVLTPQFSDDFNTVSFVRMAETIDIGYRLVMEQREDLERFSLSPGQYEDYRARLTDPRTADPPVIDFLRVDNDSIIADTVIEDRLSAIEIGEPMDVDAVERAIGRVYGLEYYQTARYSVVEEDGRKGLEIDLNSRSWGPNYVQLGVQYSSSADENAVFGLAASYLRTAINDRGGEWRATFVVGDEPAFLTNLHQPLGQRGLYFVAPSLDFESRLLSVFDDQDEIASEMLLREATLELGAGREIGSWGEIRSGLRTAYVESELRVGDPLAFPEDEFRTGEFFVRLSADTLDDIAFPRSGVLATAEWRGSRPSVLSADANFDQLLVNAAAAKTWGRHTLLSTFRYDTTISGSAPINRLFRFGGFFDLSGLNRNQLSGQHVARIGASYYREIGDLALFPAFAGVSVELGDAWDSRSEISFDDARLGGSLWAGVDTPVGPVYVAYGLAENGDGALYVFLGRIF